jgi:osmotically inducible protein OsmC
MELAAKNLKKSLPQGTSVTADVDLGVHDDKKLGIRVKLSPNLPGISQSDAEEIVKVAHTICPYSHATRNNVDVTFNTTTSA